MGRFPSGVTITTTIDGNGASRGFTANAFSSASLDPPIVLVWLFLLNLGSKVGSRDRVSGSRCS